MRLYFLLTPRQLEMVKQRANIMRFLGFIVGIFLLVSGYAAAGPQATQDTDVMALMQSLPEKTIKRLRETPARFRDEASVLIYGYGRDGAIDAAGLERFILLERAEARGGVLRRFADADLDNDGIVQADELAIKADTLAASGRGRLRLAFTQSDLDRDGSLSGVEMRALAELGAMERLSEVDADILRAFMLFDLDGNGAVTVAEVGEVARMLAVDA